ncbi:hypothetical protein M0R45_025874 [Rubus argutus]|uniref:Uncharacterized protein n=1 Tax=Rubus argutus TaxID=59490 RepID=A0AAW1WY73_RUBAR
MATTRSPHHRSNHHDATSAVKPIAEITEFPVLQSTDAVQLTSCPVHKTVTCSIYIAGGHQRTHKSPEFQPAAAAHAVPPRRRHCEASTPQLRIPSFP